MRHHSKCIFKVGDRVAFKKPRRNKIRGTVEHIETDPTRAYWSEGGTVPRYIRVKVDKVDRDTGVIFGHEHVWTTQNKLIWSS